MKLKLSFLVIVLFFSIKGFASYILIPMDAESQAEHLKAYGITYWVLEKQVKEILQTIGKAPPTPKEVEDEEE